jgi:hypothetical protein
MNAGEDRLTVNLVEWRKGYSYSVRPQPLCQDLRLQLKCMH